MLQLALNPAVTRARSLSLQPRMGGQKVSQPSQGDSFSRSVRFGESSETSIPAPTPEMNLFIDLDSYNLKEQQHAGWVKSNAIKKQILTDAKVVHNGYASTARPRILEMGCSSGTSTLPIVQHLMAKDQGEQGEAFERYDAVDIDRQAIVLLEKQLKELQQGVPSETASKVHGLVADAMRHQAPDGKPYTFALMQFALSHFDAAGKSYLLDHLSDSLKLAHQFKDNSTTTPGDPLKLHKEGFLLVTDEFLPAYHDGPSEAEALWKHHGAVIFDALVKGNFDLAQLELEALYSGLHKTGDFKITCEEFEDLLWQKHMDFEKFKTFPLNPDLIPVESGQKTEGLSCPERRAVKLWSEEAREIFELALKMKPQGDFRLPEPVRDQLKALAAKFKANELTGLRPTPKPEDIPPSPELLEAHHVCRTQQDIIAAQRAGKTPLLEDTENNWGVYTYQIKKNITLQNRKSIQSIISHYATHAASVEEAAEKLYQRYGKLEPAVDDICRNEGVAPERWHVALGCPRPSFQELKAGGTEAQAWEEKVAFSKAVLNAFWNKCYR